MERESLARMATVKRKDRSGMGASGAGSRELKKIISPPKRVSVIRHAEKIASGTKGRTFADTKEFAQTQHRPEQSQFLP